MCNLNQQADAARTAKSTLKRVLPALLLMSMALSTSAMAQEPSTGTSAQDASMDELLSEMVPATQDEATAAPAQSPATPAAQEAPATATAETPAASSSSAEADQPPPATPEQPAAAELDVIPVPQRADKSAVAEHAPRGRQIEEVVVTAQKREQVSQDVPISMSVMSDTFIRDQGITDVKDALLFVPNFKIVEFANVVSPQCRGFTVTEANPAFEPPCGFALDGIAYARAAYFSSGLFDLKRMEVLRGPQGTTFGKNTVAGLISLVSKDPTDEFTANADLQYGLVGAGQKRIEVGVGGPLIPGVVNFRVAGMREKRDGFMENTYHEVDPSVPKEAGGRDRSTYRIKLTFPDVFGTQIKLLHERSDLSSIGLTNKVSAPEGSAWATYLRSYDPNIDFGKNYRNSNLGAELKTVITRSQFEWSTDVKDWGVTLVGATGELTNHSDLNANPYPVPFAHSTRDEVSPFTTVELRTTSPEFDGLFGLDGLFDHDLGHSNMLAGVFFQRNEIKRLSDHVDLSYLGTVGTIVAASGVALPLGDVAQLVHTLYGSELGEWYESVFGQKTQTEAVFGQFTWNMTEQWNVDLSGRLSREAKEAHWHTSYSTPAPILNLTGDRAFTRDKEISSLTFQPKIALGYKATDDINLFAHWARAFVSGGFNFFTIAGDPEKANPTNPGAGTGSLSYGDETATEWGFDAKMRLFDNQMQLNLSLFRLDVTDLQVLTSVSGTSLGNGVALPNGYQTVVNAGKARAQGVEADMTWLATDWLTVISSLGYNDTNYLSFPNDDCSTAEIDAGKANSDTKKCDHTGKPFLNVPKLGGTLTLDSHFPLGGIWSGLSDMEFQLGATAEYVGSLYNPNYDAVSKQKSYYRYRAHAGLSNPAQGWTLRVTALNLMNKYIAQYSVASNLTSIDPQPPRSIFAQFSWNY